MARRRNIFDFAAKELSATAFWAWVIDAEHSDDAELKSLNADLRRKLNVPSDAVLESLELEKNPDDPGLKLDAPSDTEERNDRRRIDILVTYRRSDGSRLRLVIENKVRRDPNVIEQVTDYRDRLQKRVTGPVRAAILTFDDALAPSRRAADNSIVVVTLSAMLSLLSEHASANSILVEYQTFLRDKLTIANATPVRGSDEDLSENREKWSAVATQRGIQPLLDAYIASAQRCGFAVKHSKGRSIFLTAGTKAL